jgi:hypothetical protein
MKRFITTFLMTALLAISIPALSGTAMGQTRYYRSSRVTRSYYNNNQPNVYDRHRKAINIGVATGIGALLGGIIGGKKGAVIGAAAGVAGGAIVNAKQSPRNYTRYRRY